MKKLILIIVLLPFMVFGQAPKNTNCISIKTGLSSAENFIQVKRVLADAVIEIANQDKDVYQIKTGDVPVNKYGASQYFVINCKEGEIVLSGMWKSGIETSVYGVTSKDSYAKTVNKGFGLVKQSFEKMNEFAKSFGTDINYFEK